MYSTTSATRITNVVSILRENPKVRNEALAGTVEANIIGFSGFISVVTKTHQFAAGSFESRVIYISPFGNFKNFLVNVKRGLVGVHFPDLTCEGDITKYILGTLETTSQAYKNAQQATNEAFEQKRRLVIAIAVGQDGSAHMAIDIEKCQGACIIL